MRKCVGGLRVGQEHVGGCGWLGGNHREIERERERHAMERWKSKDGDV